MNVLVLASAPVTADELLSHLGPAEPDDIEVMIVAPALADSPVKFWLSDADEAIARAEKVRAQTLEQLSGAGIPAAADTGEADPGEAIADALRTFDADRIVIFKRSEESQRYREDIDAGEVNERFGLPVEEAILAGPANGG